MDSVRFYNRYGYFMWICNSAGTTTEPKIPTQPLLKWHWTQFRQSTLGRIRMRYLYFFVIGWWSGWSCKRFIDLRRRWFVHRRTMALMKVRASIYVDLNCRRHKKLLAHIYSDKKSTLRTVRFLLKSSTDGSRKQVRILTFNDRVSFRARNTKTSNSVANSKQPGDRCQIWWNISNVFWRLICMDFYQRMPKYRLKQVE